MGETVAWIGMGLLGPALAENLIRADFTVRGYDVAPRRVREHVERGGVAAGSPADAARGAAVALTCLMAAALGREAPLGPDGPPDAAGPGAIGRHRRPHHPHALPPAARLLAARAD